MEERKAKEIEHYDEVARVWQDRLARGESNINDRDVAGVEVMLMASYRHIYSLLPRYVTGKDVLDYGCGHGMHAVPMALLGARVTGIDLSEESLKLARGRAEREGVADKINFLQMDCEAPTLKNGSFDVVFDGGTFSSLDTSRAFPEIARVLRPGGFLIGIETLGHNPLANFKRWLNKKRGIRTGWAAEHILKMSDFETLKQYFDVTEARFFHFLSMFAFPFRNLPGGKIAFQILDRVDNALFTALPPLRKYAFKTVFVLKKK